MAGEANDCELAKTPTELAICADPALAKLDAQLNRDYKAFRDAYQKSDNHQCLLEDEAAQQKAWLKDRDACGSNAKCIEDAYQSRIDGLGKYSRMCVVGDCFGTANQGRTCAQHCNDTPVSNPTTPTTSTPVTAPATSSCEKISPTNNPSEISSYNKSNLNLSQSGVDAIVAEEGIANCMYEDSVGYATVGIGHLLLPRSTIANLATKAPSEFEKYRNGMTDSEAYALEKKDVEKRVINVMVNKIKVKLNPCQMDALISLAFNNGPSAPMSVYNLINECNFEGAADEFLNLPGLTSRHQREREIFLNCSYPNRKAAHIPCCEYTVTAIDAVNKGSKYQAQCSDSCSKGGACYGV